MCFLEKKKKKKVKLLYLNRIFFFIRFPTHNIKCTYIKSNTIHVKASLHLISYLVFVILLQYLHANSVMFNVKYVVKILRKLPDSRQKPQHELTKERVNCWPFGAPLTTVPAVTAE